MPTPDRAFCEPHARYIRMAQDTRKEVSRGLTTNEAYSHCQQEGCSGFIPNQSIHLHHQLKTNPSKESPSRIHSLLNPQTNYESIYKMCFTSNNTEPTAPPRRTAYTNYNSYLRERDRYQREREAYLQKEKEKKRRKRRNYAGVYAAGSVGAAGCCGGGGGGC